MRPSALSLILAVFQIAPFSLAIPIQPATTHPLALRSQSCANGPSTIASTPSARRALSPCSLAPRHGTNTVTWSAPNSRTHVLITMVRAVAGSAITDLLQDAQRHVRLRLIAYDDTVIAGGRFAWMGAGQNEVTVQNSNNHQVTYGVLKAALEALYAYMLSDRGFVGEAGFVVFDGANEVGRGVVGVGLNVEAEAGWVR